MKIIWFFLAYIKKKSYLCSRNNKDNNSLNPKSRKGIKIMKTTLNEVKNWMRRMNIEEGCSIPMVINGGGFSWITPSDDIDIILDGDKKMEHFNDFGVEYDEEVYMSAPMFDDYAEDVTVLSKGEEFADFKSCMGEEYDDMTFILIHHNNGYNEENCDIQIGVWDYNFEA